jgi:hypothetical protein
MERLYKNEHSSLLVWTKNKSFITFARQAKELRLELERKDAELRELHLSKLSLQVAERVLLNRKYLFL